MNRSALWYKLKKTGVGSNSKLLKVIQSLYQETKSCVLINDKQTEYFNCNVGVRQGENLSPLLFALFLNDLEEHLIMNGIASIKFDYEVCNQLLNLMVMMYADDTSILADSASKLQKAGTLLSNMESEGE